MKTTREETEYTEEFEDDVEIQEAHSVPRRSTRRQSKNNELRQALALRSFHLPGYSVIGDWFQYMFNNHPLIGICCHHPLHPLSMSMRVVCLVGSIAFGLAITNLLWIWFIWKEMDQHEVVITLQLGNTTTIETPEQNGFVITRGMILLWTVGGSLHALFDNTIWFITTCACCLPGQSLSCCSCLRKYFQYVAVMLVAVTSALATLVILLRVAVEGQQQENQEILVESELSMDDVMDPVGDAKDQVVTVWEKPDISAYDFLMTYATELGLTYSLYYFCCGTLLFSGVLGCYRVPVLGGRPYELRRKQLQRERNYWRS